MDIKDSTPPELSGYYGVQVDMPPELSDWQCEMFGSGPFGICFRPAKGCEPNWFWRWMQYLCFGNKWVRRPERRP